MNLTLSLIDKNKVTGEAWNQKHSKLTLKIIIHDFEIENACSSLHVIKCKAAL